MQKINFNDRYGLTHAVIEGRKIMTRRPIKVIYDCYTAPSDKLTIIKVFDNGTIWATESRYKVGEVVAVAQRYSTIAAKHPDVDTFLLQVAKAHKISIESVHDLAGWNNKMFTKAELMPHQVRITGIKCERLQDISDADCMKEGVSGGYIGFFVPGIKCKDWEKESHVETEDGNVWKLFPAPRRAFASLIDKVSGRGTWGLNPWVVVYEFELVK